MIDQLRQMAIFAKTIDHGSFSGAARELGLSPSVVSHHISQLEEHLGVALIYRSTRRLTLTREGERLLEVTRRMLDSVEDELIHMSVTAKEPSGEIRVTVPSVLSQSSVVEHLVAFAKRYPRIKLLLDFSDTRKELIENGLDLALRMGPKAPKSVTSRTLFTVKRNLVASVDYSATRPEPLTPKDIVDWDWLALVPAQRGALAFAHADGETLSIKPEAGIATTDSQALYRLARAGAGLAIVPDFLAQDDVAAGKMVHVLPEWELPAIQVFAVWPVNAPKHGLVHLVLNALIQPKPKRGQAVMAHNRRP